MFCVQHVQATVKVEAVISQVVLVLVQMDSMELTVTTVSSIENLECSLA